MADLQTQYVLTTPGGTITFNTGQLRDGTDKYWIQNIEGLDGASLRIPMDPVPFADGALLHTSYRDARHILIEGVLVTETAGFPGGGDACVQRQNEMEDDLLDALESIIATDGTLAWTPLGLSARSLTVRRDQTAEFAPGENFAIKTFTFGLIAADPTWQMGIFVINPHPGLLQRGNLDLTRRPVVRNRDGTISTVASMSFGIDFGGRDAQVLCTSVFNGRRVDDEDAVFAHYDRTGLHLGIFDTVAHVNAYAQALHRWQAKYYKNKLRPKRRRP